MDDGLLYVRRGCEADDVKARFFLHLDPVDPDDRRRYGFDAIGFDFPDAPGATCVAEVPLPSYPIAAIRTGQFVRTEDGGFRNLWTGEIRLDE